MKHKCKICEEVAQAHHDSYEEGKELDVRWLCQPHHKAWHMIIDQVGRTGSVNERFCSFVDSYKQ